MNMNKQTENSLVNLVFKDYQLMRVVEQKDNEDSWWCKGEEEEVGLWLYSGEFIRKNIW